MHISRGRAQLPGAYPLGFSARVLDRHHVTWTEFNATMRYYSRHPSAFETLYDGVIDTLNAVRQRAVNRTRADTSRRRSP